ncbi:MAG TPA: glycerol-3-phosphate 1-O-acyltransferase PlsY [Anaerolineae bacterium]|nr:glycerol-3-phosphate 1-O-acyltransferase PlsY [Anaerolineae bacterium]
MEPKLIYIAVAFIAMAYILGSIPFGIIIGRALYGVDVRKFGSGNIGATNCYRTLGVAAGVAVLMADISKGLVPVVAVKAVLADSPDVVPMISVIVGLAAVLGHSYSVFLGFTGGKGMATASGLILALWPWAAPILIGAWIVIVALTRYVSLASMVVAVLLPVLIIVLYPRTEYIVFSVAIAAVVVYRHRSNISRLIAGKELKIGEKVSLGED